MGCSRGVLPVPDVDLDALVLGGLVLGIRKGPGRRVEKDARARRGERHLAVLAGSPVVGEGFRARGHPGGGGSVARGVQREGGRPGPAVVAVGEEGDRAVVGDGEPQVAPFPAGGPCPPRRPSPRGRRRRRRRPARTPCSRARRRYPRRRSSPRGRSGAPARWPGRAPPARSRRPGGAAHRRHRPLPAGRAPPPPLPPPTPPASPVRSSCPSPTASSMRYAHPGAAVPGQPEGLDPRDARLRQVGQAEDQQ